jgi:hypothetical protein
MAVFTGSVPTVRRHRTVGHGVSGGALVTATGRSCAVGRTEVQAGATLTKTATIESLMVEMPA